jgi:hypothetical protein
MRSAYRAPMRFYRDSDTTINVDWSFVPATNGPMPWSSAFTSAIYDRKEDPPSQIGEQYSPVPWRGGRPPYALPAGSGICGTREQWQQGCSITDPIPTNYANTSVPICCSPPPIYPQGGISIGGTVTVVPPPDLCHPGVIETNLCMSATWIGAGSPPSIPPYGVGPSYEAPLTFLSPGWQSGTYYAYYLATFCGTFNWRMECLGGIPFFLDSIVSPTIPGCGVNFPSSVVPNGGLTSLETVPTNVVFTATTPPQVGWKYTVTNKADCLATSACCPSGFGATRTFTVSGSGMSGTIKAYASGGTYPSWSLNSTAIVGCAGTFSAVVQCSPLATSPPGFVIEFNASSCYYPGGGLYQATSVNCALPMVVWSGLPGGVTITMT